MMETEAEVLFLCRDHFSLLFCLFFVFVLMSVKNEKTASTFLTKGC